MNTTTSSEPDNDPIGATLSQKPGYDYSIDAIRGIACILLIAFHVIGEKPEFGLRVDVDHPLGLFSEIFIHLRMPLFAMLSGFVYAYRPASKGAMKPYFTAKARRLVLPYLFAATAFAGINTILGGSYAVPLEDFWQVYVLSYSQFWFIQSILLMFVIMGLVDMVFGNDKPWPALILLGISCLAFLSPIANGVIVFSLDKAFYRPRSLLAVWYSIDWVQCCPRSRVMPSRQAR